MTELVRLAFPIDEVSLAASLSVLLRLAYGLGSGVMNLLSPAVGHFDMPTLNALLLGTAPRVRCEAEGKRDRSLYGFCQAL